MNIRTTLLKLFVRYGVKGAHQPSYRGCFETKVPQAAITMVKQEKHDRTGKH